MARVTSQKIRQALLVTGDPLDPNILPEKIQLFNEEGQPLTLGGFGRDTMEYSTASLASEEIEDGTLVAFPSWRIFKAATNRPARVRMYATEAQRLADAERKIGVDPEGDHGLLFELITTAEILSYTLSPTVDLSADAIDSETPGIGNYFLAITNLDTVSGIVTVTFNYLRTE